MEMHTVFHPAAEPCPLLGRAVTWMKSGKWQIGFDLNITSVLTLVPVVEADTMPAMNFQVDQHVSKRS